MHIPVTYTELTTTASTTYNIPVTYTEPTTPTPHDHPTPYLATAWPIVHEDWRPHWKWGHRENCNNQPIRPGKTGAEPQNFTLLIWYPFEDLMHTLSSEWDFLLLGVFKHLFPFGCEVKGDPSDFWLGSATAAMILKWNPDSEDTVALAIQLGTETLFSLYNSAT